MPYTLSQFKEVLDGLGYNLGPDGLNGNNGNALDAYTQAAIQELQAQHGLPTTGKLDLATEKLAQTLVRSLQHDLNLAISAKLPITDFYGPRMVQAVKTFQRNFGLPITGVASFTVRQRLAQVVGKPTGKAAIALA